MAQLNNVKTALRISPNNTSYDAEVEDLIAAARDDMRLSGVLASKVTSVDDALINRAITIYVKANFGFDNPDAERLQSSYESIKSHLCLSKEYTVEEAESP